MPILNGLSTKNKAEINVNGKWLQKVFCGDKLVWQKLQEEEIHFGWLYNWLAAIDSRKISSNDDWVVPIYNGGEPLFTILYYAGGTNIAGGKLKKTGFVYWNDPNTDATDDFGFGLLGAGYRDYTGNYPDFKTGGYLWSSRESSVDQAYYIAAFNNQAATAQGGMNKKNGASIKLVKSAPGLSDGVMTTYTGNNGIVYDAIVIDEWYWITENLRETHFRTGEEIPTVTDATAWSNLTTAGKCAPNGDEANV